MPAIRPPVLERKHAPFAGSKGHPRSASTSFHHRGLTGNAYAVAGDPRTLPMEHHSSAR